MSANRRKPERQPDAPPKAAGPALANITCPLCGGPNECGPARCGHFDNACWCTTVSFSREALARVPDELRNKACLCRQCATQAPSRVI